MGTWESGAARPCCATLFDQLWMTLRSALILWKDWVAASVHEFATGDRDEDASLWHECAHLAGVLRSIARLDLSTTEGGAHSRGMAGRTESSYLDLPGGSGQD